MKDLFLHVFEISLSTSAVVLVLLILSTVLNRRYAAKWKYGIWILLAMRLAIPMQVSLPKKQVVVLDIPTRITAPIAIDRGPAVAVTPTIQASAPSITPLDVIAVIWLVGAAAYLAVHLFSYWRYKHKVMRNCTRVTDLSILQQVRSIARELGLRDRIPVIQDPNAGSPMVLGFFHPVLVLPETEYQPMELYFVLKHELVHMKRHDVFAKLLFVLAGAIHWFNPLVHLMQKEAVVDMELSCDERVIKGTVYETRKAYTETLLSTMCRQYQKSTTLTTEFYGGKKIMKKRFRNILNRAKKRNGFMILTVTLMMTLALSLLIGCSAQKPNGVLETQESNPPVAENAHTRGTINSSALNIRKEPSVSSENVGVLRQGEEVEILETQGDWGRIDRGWIYLYYVDMDSGSQETTGNPEDITSSSRLNIRKEPSVSSENVGVLQQGEEVEILETQGDWGRIDRGWIYLEYVDMDSGNQKATVNADRKEMLNAAGVATKFAMARFCNDMNAMWQYLTPDWEGIFFDITFDKFPVESELQVQGMERPGDISLSSKDPVSIYNNPVPVGSKTTMVMEVKDVNDSDNFIVCLIRQEDGWKVYDFGFEKSHVFDQKESNGYEAVVSGDDEISETIPAPDMEQLAVTANQFANAYFSKDSEWLKQFLTDPSVYQGVDNSPEKRTVNAIKGIDVSDTREVAEGEVVTVSIEYRDYEYPDSFNYITTEFVMQSGQWKVQSYIGEK